MTTRLVRFKGERVAEDLRGAHVVFSYQGRDMLGEVRSVRNACLTVSYFNGELWPVTPNAREVRVLVRTFDDEVES